MDTPDLSTDSDKLNGAGAKEEGSLSLKSCLYLIHRDENLEPD